MFGIVPENRPLSYNPESHVLCFARWISPVYAFFSTCSQVRKENLNFKAHQQKSSPECFLVSSLLGTQRSSLSSPSHLLEMIRSSLEKAFSQEIAPCTIETCSQKESLPPQIVEVETERISKTAFRITARSSDSEQSMMSIIFDLIKLGITLEEIDKAYSHMLRNYIVSHMLKVVDNFLNQSKMLLYACIASGVLGIVGGLLPIIGLMKGNSILKFFSKYFSSLQGAKQEKVFSSLAHTFRAGANTADMSTRVNESQANSLKTYDETMSKQFELRHQEYEKNHDTRIRRKDSYFSMIERFIEQWWQFFQALCR